MGVHAGVASAFLRAGAARFDAGRELSLQGLRIAPTDPQDKGTGCGAHVGAVQVEADARGEPVDLSFGEASIRAGEACLHTGETPFGAPRHIARM